MLVWRGTSSKPFDRMAAEAVPPQAWSRKKDGASLRSLVFFFAAHPCLKTYCPIKTLGTCFLDSGTKSPRSPAICSGKVLGSGSSWKDNHCWHACRRCGKLLLRSGQTRDRLHIGTSITFTYPAGSDRKLECSLSRGSRDTSLLLQWCSYKGS